VKKPYNVKNLLFLVEQDIYVPKNYPFSLAGHLFYSITKKKTTPKSHTLPVQCHKVVTRWQVPLSEAITSTIRKYHFFHTIPISFRSSSDLSLSDSVQIVQVGLKDSNATKTSG